MNHPDRYHMMTVGVIHVLISKNSSTDINYAFISLNGLFQNGVRFGAELLPGLSIS